MQSDLSALDSTHHVGVKPLPVQTDLNKEGLVRFEEGNCLIVQLPPDLNGRPIPAFSRVDIAMLARIDPLTNFPHHLPPPSALGRKGHGVGAASDALP